MKEFLTLSILLPLLLWQAAGCSSKNRDAFGRLAKAQAFYEKNELVMAKNEIDSIRQYYPEEPDVLRGALELTRRVELKEAERNIAYCDSLVPVKRTEAEALIKKNFVLEKNEKYQTIGNYVNRALTLEKNVERSYIRCEVSERGEINLASIYFGSSPLNHTGLKASIATGLSASTSVIPYDGGVNYRFKDMGNTYEIVNYRGDKGMDVIKFIYANAKERIKIEYTGGRAHIIYIDDVVKKVVATTYELAAVLSDIDRMEREREISARKKEYLEEKIGLMLN